MTNRRRRMARRDGPGARWAIAGFGLLAFVAAAALGGVRPSAAVPQAPGTPELRRAIDRLGATDYAGRAAAGRLIRRTPAADAVPALTAAVTDHPDGFVRFRALVLLTGFADPRTRDLALDLLASPNDRLREVAYRYFEAHPGRDAVPVLLEAIERERAEFVRPSLVRALAAHADDPRIRAALLAEIGRGPDFHRGAVVQALGETRASFAAPALVELARQPGALQGEAAIALARTGDRGALAVLSSLQRTAPREIQPEIAAGICLLGVNCATHLGYLEKVLQFGERNPEYQPLLRHAAAALGAVAQSGSADAVDLLFAAGVPARDPARAPIALALGGAALRNPTLILAWFERHADRDGPIELLREGFDMLEEDVDKERFFVAIRRAYWQAAEGSEARRAAEALIQKLDF